MAITWHELRDARRLAGWTQQQLAAEMGVALRSIVNYEKTDGVIPTKAQHAATSVLAPELARLARMREEGEYVSSPTSDIAEVVPVADGRATFARNPRLAGITTTEMLRELLAREEEAESPSANVGGATDDVDVAEGLPRLSPAELAELRKEDQALAAHRRGNIEAEQEGSAEF